MPRRRPQAHRAPPAHRIILGLWLAGALAGLLLVAYVTWAAH
jgi:hypothetical protein